MRKKILILGHDDATQFIDVYNQYARLFPISQFEVTIAYLKAKNKDAAKRRALAGRVIFFDFSKRTLRGLKIFPIVKLTRLCLREKFDMVICHRYKPSYIMMWVAKFCKIRALLFVMHELNTMISKPRQLAIACLYQKNMLFAGVSHAVANDIKLFLKTVPKKNIVTLHNMIDVALTEPKYLLRDEARHFLKINQNDFIFGNLARLVPNKDHTSLIKAFSKIKKDCPRAKLIIMGVGQLEASLKNTIQSLNLQHDIILTGFIAEGFKYMKAFDCFILSSTQEAFGRVLLEAMIAKRPIIATRVHGIPEVVENIGTLVDAKDVDQMAAAMKNIYDLSFEARLAKGEASYQHAISEFSIPKFYEQFWNVPLLQTLKN